MVSNGFSILHFFSEGIRFFYINFLGSTENQEKMLLFFVKTETEDGQYQGWLVSQITDEPDGDVTITPKKIYEESLLNVLNQKLDDKNIHNQFRSEN